ncbi:MAG: hypothetical protein ACMUIE_09290, partial [Thermoplasmatota archaeon]
MGNGYLGSLIAAAMVVLSGAFILLNETDNVRGASVWVVDQGGGGTHTSISSALAIASDGDTIIVNPGTYNEQVTITTNGITILGVNPKATIVNPGSGAIGITIGANWVNIT